MRTMPLILILLVVSSAFGQQSVSYTLKDSGSTLNVRRDGYYTYTKNDKQFFGQVGVETQGDLLLFGESVPGSHVFGHVNTATCEMSFRVDLAGVEVLTGTCESYKRMESDLDYRASQVKPLVVKQPSRFNRHFWASTFVDLGGTGADWLSSRGRKEAGPLKNSTDGLNSGAYWGLNAGLYALSVIAQKNHPKGASIIRYAIGAVHWGNAVHNWTVKR